MGTFSMHLIVNSRFLCQPLKTSNTIVESVISSVTQNLMNSDCVFYPYFQGFMEGRSLLVVYVFTSPDSPRGPPWNEGHRPKVRHETSVLEVPAQEQHEHSFCSSSTNAFISYSLYKVRRYYTSPGTPDLRARLG